MTHKYEGQWGIVVWRDDARRWRGHQVKHPAHEMVTLRFVHEAAAVVRGTGGMLGSNLRPGYAITFHLDTLVLFVPANRIKRWLHHREGTRYAPISDPAYFQASPECA